MRPPSQQSINPMLQYEIAAHHAATSVAAILAILQAAEEGDLIAQAELFHDMEERDAHIFAEITKRKMALAQLDWHLIPRRDAGATEKKATAKLEATLNDLIDIETLVFNLADGIGHGFSAHEIEWQQQEGLWLPKKISQRPPTWFTVDRQTRQTIRLRNNTVGGDELQPYSWIIHQHSTKSGYPSTSGLYRALALPYLFKNFATKNWLRFCELYAVPIRVLFNHEQDETKKRELLRQLAAMGKNGVALLDGGVQDDLKTVDAATGEGAGFLALIEWCEQSISKAILGGTLTSSTGKNGNYATARTHDDMRYMIRDHDARQIEETLTTQLINAIVTLNGLSISPKLTFDTQEPDDLALYADAIPKLVAVGAKIPVSYLYDKLKIPLPEGDELILGAPTNSTPQQALSALAGEIPKATPFTAEQMQIEKLADELLTHLKPPLHEAAIASAIRGATSPEDLVARLAVVLKDADYTEFTQQVERCLFAADVMGYAHAN